MLKKKKSSEIPRNIILIILAVGMLVIFFSADPFKKKNALQEDNMFTGKMIQKIVFVGQLKGKELDLSKEETKKLKQFMAQKGELFQQVKVDVSKQDSYVEMTGKTQVLFSLEMEMHDGATVKTPPTRTTRKDLVNRMIWKISKEATGYENLRIKPKGDSKMKKLITS